jgi:hypothetical protein
MINWATLREKELKSGKIRGREPGDHCSNPGKRR